MIIFSAEDEVDGYGDDLSLGVELECCGTSVAGF